MRIIWLPEARDDIQRLYDFLLERDENAAERAVQAIRLGSQRLLEHPNAGRRMDDETGRRELVLPFGGSGYVIRYLLHDDMVVIVRVWHGREKRI